MRVSTSKMLTAFVAMAAAVAVAPVSALDVSAAYKAADRENGKNIYMNGKGSVPACSSCHGAEGMGEDSMGTPKLKGQGYSYLVKQLEDFAGDKRMDNTMFVMNANAKGLSTQDRRDVAAFLYDWADQGTLKMQGSNLEEVKQLGHATGVTHRGEALVTFGAPKRGIPSCYSCHQFNGRGAYPMYPQLAGQKYVYLVAQLQKWRDGSRANDPMGQMQAVAKNLSDDDIRNVASFLTNAPLTTMGNDFIAHDYQP